MDFVEKYNPEFKHINDTIAFAVHLSMLQHDCQLIGLNENQFLEDLGSVPQRWNENPEIYQFRYILKKNINDKNKQQLTILVKILSISDDEMMVSILQQNNNEKVFTLDVNINDHINVDNFKKDKKDYKTHYKNLDGLLLLIKENITKKVIGDEKKEEQKEDEQNKRPLLIDYEDNPYMIPPRGMGGGQRPIPNPYGDFGGDIDPFGGDFGPGPLIGGIGGGIGGGGLMGPQHPKFQQPQIDQKNRPNNVPPNARFDPWAPGPLGKKPGPNPDHMPPPNGGGGGMFI